MKVPFCLPLIDQPIVDEMMDTLTNTGWLTTGPKVKAFEQELVKLTETSHVLCVNSWNAGATLMMKWFGLKPDDEVIVPAYTYSATALAPINIGVKVIMVDVGDDFNINAENLKAAITSKTKIIMPVDIGGWPCDYNAIKKVINSPEIKNKFVPEHENQQKLGRILILADSAHSIGSTYNNKSTSCSSDISCYSFHSVKNITTGEGGAVSLNLPKPFDNLEVYNYLKHFYLYGQTRSAFSKNKTGKWRYDIVSPGLKCNMSDIAATIGLSQIRRYKSTLLPERIVIFKKYNDKFSQYDWAQLPILEKGNNKSCCHLYQLRFRNISEKQRDAIMDYLIERHVGVSVHYIPMAMMTYFKEVGYKMVDYPITYDNYSREISLPIYNGLSLDKVDYVIDTVIAAYQAVIGNSKEISTKNKQVSRNKTIPLVK